MPIISNEERYQAASDLFDVDPKRCIAQAKTNFQVFHISSYWIIENSLLIACAENDWKEAEYWRLFAEGVYKEALHQAKRQNDTVLLEVLAVVREELDEVKEKLIDALHDMMNAARDKMEEEKKDEGDEWDDEKMLIDSLPGMTDAERDEMEEKGENIEKQQAKEDEKAGIGAVVSARKDTLKPPCALPLRSKSDTHN